jgi:Glycosyl-hydrolase 97 C-terminal, oligomerisation
VTIARRRGKEWYVGSMTKWDARNLGLAFSLTTFDHDSRLRFHQPLRVCSPNRRGVAKLVYGQVTGGY